MSNIHGCKCTVQTALHLTSDQKYLKCKCGFTTVKLIDLSATKDVNTPAPVIQMCAAPTTTTMCWKCEAKECFKDSSNQMHIHNCDVHDVGGELWKTCPVNGCMWPNIECPKLNQPSLTNSTQSDSKTAELFAASLHSSQMFHDTNMMARLTQTCKIHKHVNTRSDRVFIFFFCYV